MNYKHTFYVGPSRFTGREVHGIITTRSNGKVGGAAGLIFVSPGVVTKGAKGPGAPWFHAHKSGSQNLHDACGLCPLGAGNDCYVQSNVQTASQPGAAINDDEFLAAARRAVWKSGLRSAVAGDAACLPEPAFRALKAEVDFWAGGRCKWLGYTHDHTATWLQGTHVASCESLEQAAELRAQGWRTFTAIGPDAAEESDGVLTFRLPHGTFLCPASHEAGVVRGRKLTCAECWACTGTDTLPVDKPHPVTLRHGTKDHRWRKRAVVIDSKGRIVGKGG